MRRPLTVVAVALILFETEVATGAVSVAAVRMWAGFVASLTGTEFVISGPRYVTGALFTLAGGVLFGVMLWAERAQGGIRTEGSVCPNCGTQTKRVRRRKRHRIPVSNPGNRRYPTELRALWLERARRVTHMWR